MPSDYTHLITAEKILETLPREISVMTGKRLYYIGALGGDFAFLYPSFRFPHGNFGKYLHTGNSYPVFSEMSRFCSSRRDLLPYCLGYLTHYATDIAFHLYIGDELCKRRKGRYFHLALEREIDAYFRGKEEREFPCVDMLSYEEFFKIGELYGSIAQNLLNRRLSQRRIRTAFFLYRFMKERKIFFGERERREFLSHREKWEKCLLDAVTTGKVLITEFVQSLDGGKELSPRLFVRDFSGKTV